VVTPSYEQPCVVYKTANLSGTTDPQVPNLFMALDSNEQKVLGFADHGDSNHPVVPLWFGWADPKVKEQAHAATIKPGETAEVLLIEATEKGAAGTPKKVKLLLTVLK
jgi:hypothetical protein